MHQIAAKPMIPRNSFLAQLRRLSNPIEEMRVAAFIMNANANQSGIKVSAHRCPASDISARNDEFENMNQRKTFWEHVMNVPNPERTMKIQAVVVTNGESCARAGGGAGLGCWANSDPVSERGAG
jgi:hypothetical protein